MLLQEWEGLRRYDRAWVHQRQHPSRGTGPIATGPIAFDDPAGVFCGWQYGWRVVLAFELPAILGTGGTMMNCASPNPFGLRLHRHIRPLLVGPLLCAILLAAVCLQWYLIGKWFDRFRWASTGRKSRLWSAVLLGGPVFLWLAYLTPIAQHILIFGTLIMVLLWPVLLVYIGITWKKVREAAQLPSSRGAPRL
jgi:hypothetical protein